MLFLVCLIDSFPPARSMPRSFFLRFGTTSVRFANPSMSVFLRGTVYVCIFRFFFFRLPQLELFSPATGTFRSARVRHIGFGQMRSCTRLGNNLFCQQPFFRCLDERVPPPLKRSRVALESGTTRLLADDFSSFPTTSFPRVCSIPFPAPITIVVSESVRPSAIIEGGHSRFSLQGF